LTPFKNAIVRLPCQNISAGLTTINLGKPNYQNSLIQHTHYTKALRQCGLEVIILDPDDRFPDSTFVEDTAMLTPDAAIITRPGAPSRRGEIVEMEEALQSHFQKMFRISAPGTLDAGDILQIDQHYFIGLSRRTNREGAGQLISILESLGFSGSTVLLKDMFHLKSGVSYLDNGYLVVAGEFINHPVFSQFQQIRVDTSEMYAANCLWLNGTVLVASGYPKTLELIEKAGFPVMEVEVSEFRKVDGGLSCLSLRF
jgi:dimethylargininase